MNCTTRQKLLNEIKIVDGALHLIGEGGAKDVIVVGPKDVAVLCTGQRAEGFGPGYHRSCAEVRAAWHGMA